MAQINVTKLKVALKNRAQVSHLYRLLKTVAGRDHDRVYAKLILAKNERRKQITAFKTRNNILSVNVYFFGVPVAAVAARCFSYSFATKSGTSGSSGNTFCLPLANAQRRSQEIPQLFV